jgi:hypothetical protein
MNEQREGVESRRQSGQQVVRQTIWVLVALLTVALYIADFSVRYERLLHFFEGEGSTVLSLGRSPRFFALYFMWLDLTTALAYAVTALVIFWRRSDDKIALLLSLALITFGAAITPATDLLQTSTLEWRATLAPLQTLGRGLSIIALYLFPNGRFVPRWTRPLSVLCALWLLFSLLFPAAPFSWYAWPLSRFVLVFTGWYGSAVFAQIYRYRRHASPLQQQQTKWIVFGFAAAVAGRILFSASEVTWPALRSPSVAHAIWLLVSAHLLWGVLLVVPVTFGIAVLRYRLWEIDIIIRRTLIYSTLTAALALVYVGGVFVLQSLFLALTGQRSQLAIVISTLGSAALFDSLRRRIQDGIDRRFYRSRYDAEQIVAAFSAATRNEVELERLIQTQLAIVQETWQPSHLSFWLYHMPDRSTKRDRMAAKQSPQQKVV